MTTTPSKGKQKTNFRLFPKHAYLQFKTKIIRSLTKYTQHLDDWIKLLIHNHSFHQRAESLLLYLTQQTKLIIVTNGSKYENKNGGSWIIALANRKQFDTGHNQNFGKANKTSFYRTEVYAPLASLLFIHHYAKYYKITLNNKFNTICGNEAYVNKLQQLMDDPYQF